MADPMADYQKAADGFAVVLGRVGDRWDAASPCEGWTAADVADHIIGGTGYFAGAFGGTPAEVDGDRPTQYAAQRAALVDAASQEGVLDRTVTAPFGPVLPIRVMLGIYTTDTLLHTWDLARSIGEEVGLDADLLQRSWDGAKPMDAVLRGNAAFGPIVETDDDAPMQARALGFFGRRA